MIGLPDGTLAGRSAHPEEHEVTLPYAESSHVEWWVRWVPAVLILDVALFSALHARPGQIGPLLWVLGPPCLATVDCGFLLAAFVGAVRRRVFWNRWRSGACLGLAAVMASIPIFYGSYPSSHDRSPSRVRFLLPLDGPITVAWGGPTRDTNYHVTLTDQRWAYDLLVTRQGTTFDGSGRRVQDYYAYDRLVMSPASGLVREVHDGDPDSSIGAKGAQVGSLGNHVVLEVAPGEFLVLAHLRAGSVRVAVGDAVESGHELGRVGNSGYSTEPHLHVHLQDRVGSLTAEGIPFDFSRYLCSGRLVEAGMPLGGRRRGRFVGQVIERQQGATTLQSSKEGRTQRSGSASRRR
jgi:hypothetical protein